jgi:hypothetical protein
MAEPFLDDLWMLTSDEQEACMSMAEVVEADLAQSMTRQRRR